MGHMTMRNYLVLMALTTTLRPRNRANEGRYRSQELDSCRARPRSIAQCDMRYLGGGLTSCGALTTLPPERKPKKFLGLNSGGGHFDEPKRRRRNCKIGER